MQMLVYINIVTVSQYSPNYDSAFQSFPHMVQYINVFTSSCVISNININNIISNINIDYLILIRSNINFIRQVINSLCNYLGQCHTFVLQVKASIQPIAVSAIDKCNPKLMSVAYSHHIKAFMKTSPGYQCKIRANYWWTIHTTWQFLVDNGFLPLYPSS